MSADHVRGVLRAVGTDPTAREIGEILWLAHHMTDEPVRPVAGPQHVPSPEPRPPERPRPADPVPDRPSAPPVAPPVGPAVADLHVDEPVAPPARPALRVAVPQTAALADRLAFQRALRPLMRKVPSRRVEVLDEEETARFIADRPPRSSAWPPVLRPSLERWLDAAVVVDSGESMAIWQDLAGEVADALAESGAFRQVTRWRLGGTDGGRRAVFTNWRGQPHRPAELVDPTGRRAVLVVSDCVDRVWHAGAAGAVLRDWGRHGPVSILQPLPERLWFRTGAATIAGQLSAPRACTPNTALRFNPFGGMDLPEGTLVPVMEVSGSWFGRWTRMIAGGPTDTSAVTVVTGDDTGRAVPRPAAALSPLQRVRYFRAVASPEAFQLAAYVAMSEPRLPVIRHIHRAMFEPALPAHLAEVLLSGLLRVVDGRTGHYEFVEGVPGLLIDTLTRMEILRAHNLLDRVSTSVQERMSVARDHFPALTPGAGDHGLDAASRPFAIINNLGRQRVALARSGVTTTRPPRGAPPAPARPVSAGPVRPVPAGPVGPVSAGPVRPATVRPTGPPGEPGRRTGAATPTPHQVDIDELLGNGSPAPTGGVTAGAAPGQVDLEQLLAPESAVVRFHGRSADLAALEQWSAGRSEAALLLTARAGQGKSRLIGEFADRKREAGWHVVDAHRNGAQAVLAARRAPPESGLLIVVDQADAQRELVAALARSSPGGDTPTRILLAARSAAQWWQDLRHDDPSGLLRHAATRAMPPMLPDEGDPQVAFREALDDLAAALDRGAGPGAGQFRERAGRVRLPRLDDQRFVSPLTLQVAAAALLLGPAAGRVVEGIVARERRHWERVAVAAQISFTSPTALDEYVAAAVLYQAGSAAEAQEVVRLVGGVDEHDRGTLRRIAIWLHELYPGGSGEFWGGIEPTSVRRRIVTSAALRRPTMIEAILPQVLPDQARRALALLGPACHSYPQLAAPIWAAAMTDPRLCGIALAVSQTAPSGLPPALIARIRESMQQSRPEIAIGVLSAIADGVTDIGVLFADQPPSVAGRLVDSYRRLSAASSVYLAPLAEALRHHGDRLAEHGNAEAALDAVTEEVGLRRRIADSPASAEPTRAAARLAAALVVRAGRLSRVDLPVQALSSITEAVDHYRGLAGPQPDGYGSDLAAALIDRARLLGWLGRHIEAAPVAAEATDIYRVLAESDGGRHEPGLAAGLLVAAAAHRSCGERAAALTASGEALNRYRRLAATDPERHRAALAHALMICGTDLGDNGSHSAALANLAEAIDIYRELCAAAPHFLPDLATAHYSQAIHLRDLERREEALGALGAATEIYRRLTTADPPAYRGLLATAMTHQAALLAELGQPRTAVTVLTEACHGYDVMLAESPLDPEIRARLSDGYFELSRLFGLLGEGAEADRFRLQGQLLLDGGAEQPTGEPPGPS